MSEAKKMMPVLIVKPKSISKYDVKRMQTLAGIVVVECDDPQSARFIEPPVHADITDQARAALKLMRAVLKETSGKTYFRNDLAKIWADLLISEDPPKLVEHVK